jgi:hypothetical protein
VELYRKRKKQNKKVKNENVKEVGSVSFWVMGLSTVLQSVVGSFDFCPED